MMIHGYLMTYQIFTSLDQYPDGLAQTFRHGYDTEILNDNAYGWIEQWAEADVVFVEFDDQQWTSVVELFHHDVRVDDKNLAIGGISGVLTHSDYRGRGLASKLINIALDYSRAQWHIDLALLTCKRKMITYYERLGWKLLDNEIHFLQDSGKTKFDKNLITGMSYHFTDADFPDGIIDLNGYPW